MRRLLLIVGAVLALVVVVVVLVAPGMVPGLSPGPTPGPSATLVPDVPVEDVLLAEARAVPVRTATVSAAVAGSVAEVRTALGAQVRAGDPLVLLDTSAVDAELAGARAALEGASARAQQAAAAADQALQGVAVASAGVTQATAGVRAASAARDLLPEDAEDARVRAADAEVEMARAALSAARSQLAGLGLERQGDVVVPVTIEPEEPVPAGIVWNMTVSVTIRPAD